jgi:hypothetical protein
MRHLLLLFLKNCKALFFASIFILQERIKSIFISLFSACVKSTQTDKPYGHDHSNKPTLQVRHMGRHTNLQHRSQPAQEPALLYTRQPSFGATQTYLIDQHGRRVFVQHWVLCKQGLMFKLRLFASLYFGSGWTEFCWAFSCYLVLLFLYWASVPGWTNNNVLPAQSLFRCV